MKNKRVGVLMGGPSPEREISIKSGKAVCKALEAKRIDYIPIELMIWPNTNGYKKSVTNLIRQMKIDVAFVALHGEFGEDGTVQEILEKMDIPHTGRLSSASRAAMNKITAKKIFKSNNIPIAKHEILTKDSFNKGCDTNAYFKNLGSKLVIKPSNGGSSIGLNIVTNVKDIKASKIGRAHV